MGVSRTVRIFVTVVDARRSSDPHDSGDDVLTGGADARSRKYLSKEGNWTHTCAKGDVILGLTDGVVAITARALMENSPHVCLWACSPVESLLTRST